MKTYRWFFLILVSNLLVSCGGTSEEELIGDWQRRAWFRDVSRSHAATFVIGNKGYVCCGYDGLKLRRKDVYVFDHTAANGMGSWQRLDDFPEPMQRRSHAVGFSVNGKGYIGTGYDGDETDMKDFWQYDPDTNQWTEVAPLPENAYSRRGAIAFTLTVDGKEYGYVGCGFHEDSNNRLYLTDFWRFDPDVDTPGETRPGSWTEEIGYGGTKREGAAVFVLDNKAYICNGRSNAASTSGTVYDFWRFDPTASEENKWKSGIPKTSGDPSLRSMNNANPDEDYDDDYGGLYRAYGVAFVVPVSGQLRGHIVGGDNSNASKTWEYDHDNDLWIQRTNFYNYTVSQGREGMISFTFPETQRAFVGMGKYGQGYMDDMWEFIPMIDDDIYSDY